jgi:hypothetical protein
MLALYRCGDTPAALSAYRAARDTLDEQLGIEPGRELVNLHRSMLDRAPELTWAPPVITVAAEPVTADVTTEPVGDEGPVVPRELPADLVTFVGRTGELAEVVAAVTRPTPAVAVVRPPAAASRRCGPRRPLGRRRLPDGQVTSTRTDRSAEEVVARAAHRRRLRRRPGAP